jgi:hypothetical protein
MKRKVRRRTFAQVRREQDENLARYLDAHAEKLRGSDQPEIAVAMNAVSGMISAGFVEGKGQ